MKVRLNAAKLNSKETAHEYLKEKFSLPEYYGNNLDALHDCLSELTDVQAEVFNYDEENADYVKRVIRVMEDSLSEVSVENIKILDWNEYGKKAVEAAAEGCVLLKNDNNALPLDRNEKVSVFGRIQAHYYKSGTGSGGMVNVTKVTGILDALRESERVTVNEELAKIYEEWEKENPFVEGEGWGNEPWSQLEMVPDEKDVIKASAESDAAIVIIGRTAGEDRDATDTPGSYRLSENEEKMLEIVCRHFDRTIVVLNVGNIIDMSFVDKYSPAAVLYVWQGGMLGGYGAERILTGVTSPSGRLTDTIARHIEDYPCANDFGSGEFNFYTEDIYLGYRYFSTFAPQDVAYPFGFGLSYTAFSVKDISASADIVGRTVSVKCTVENTGSRPGKNSVLIYVSAPQGNLGKPAKVLADYGKTTELAPGEKDELKFSISFDSFASFDDSGAMRAENCFVLEEGEYRFFIGGDPDSAEEFFSFELDENLAIEKLSEAAAPVEAFKRLRPGKATDGIYEKTYEDVPLLKVSEEVRKAANLGDEIPATEESISLKDVFYGRKSIEEFVATLSDDDLSCIVRGEGMGSPLVTPGTASAFGGVSPHLRELGIPAICCDDGPSGMRLDCGKKAFSLPIGTLLACTFNDELVEDLYSYTGLEMSENKVDVLLGPGINIHRYPLNGRNFEYFSEDPLVSGRMGAAVIRGLHLAGVTGCIKHFAGNNQEFRRRNIDSRISKRALREIYLKSFEIPVKEAKADAVMTTYGALNGLFTAGNYDLVTEILKNEWGFRGVVMTDWWAEINERGSMDSSDNRYDRMVGAGNDLYMVCADGSKNVEGDNTLESLASGKLKRSELQTAAANVCKFALSTHAMAGMLGDEEIVRIINKPVDPEDVEVGDVEFIPLIDETEVDLTYQKAEKGTNYIMAFSVEKIGVYEITLTGSSNLSGLAQVPFTIYNTGIPVASFTFNGTDGKDISISKKVGFFNRFGLMRLYAGGNGVDVKKIKFKLAFDIANASEDEILKYMESEDSL